MAGFIGFRLERMLRMKIKLLILAICIMVMGCQSLTFHEQKQLKRLEYKGVTIDRPVGDWDKPANPMSAALWSLLPGGGNFYLAGGRAGQSEQFVYGALNLLTWPLSILWAVPGNVIDANTINKRDMLQYYEYDEDGQKAVAAYMK